MSSRREETPRDNVYVREPGYAERYRDRRFTEGSGPRTHRRELAALVELLHGRPIITGPWLDVPCGAGRFSDVLPQPVVQVDRDRAMLLACPPRNGRPRACASAARLPFADATFSGVLCLRLFQHLGGPGERARVLAELARVTRGLVLFSYFEAWSAQHLRRVVRGRLGRRPSGRSAVPWSTVRFFSEQTLVLAERVS